MPSETCTVESLESESSQLTKRSQKEARIQGMATGVIQQVEGAVMVVEIGQQQGLMIVSNAAVQDTGPGTVHQQVGPEVGVHSHLHLHGLGMAGPVVVGTAIQMIVTDTWMIDTTEVVMVTEIVMTTEMIDMAPVIHMLMTGILY